MVQKAIFFIDSPIIMDFRMKSSRKIDTIASHYRSPFSRKRAIVEKCYDITFNNIKNATTKLLLAQTDFSHRGILVGSCALSRFAGETAQKQDYSYVRKGLSRDTLLWLFKQILADDKLFEIGSEISSFFSMKHKQIFEKLYSNLIVKGLNFHNIHIRLHMVLHIRQ